jgi:hypothetical protein
MKLSVWTDFSMKFAGHMVPAKCEIARVPCTYVVLGYKKKYKAVFIGNIIALCNTWVIDKEQLQLQTFFRFDFG